MGAIARESRLLDTLGVGIDRRALAASLNGNAEGPFKFFVELNVKNVANLAFDDVGGQLLAELFVFVVFLDEQAP